MARAESILTAVQRVYDAALEPEGWAAALPSVAAALHSEQICLFSQRANGAVDFITGAGIAPELVSQFAASLGAGEAPRDMLNIPVGMIVARSSMMSDREFVRSAIYNDIVRPTGAFYLAMATLLCTPERQVAFSIGRSLGKGDYGDEDLSAMKVLVPHLVAAMRVNDRLNAADLRVAGASTALDRLETGVIMVELNGRVVFANRMAEALLAEEDGLRTEEGCVSAVNTNAAGALQRRISHCAEIVLTNGGPDREIEIPRGNGRMPLRVLVAPVRPGTSNQAMAWLEPTRRMVLLTVTDPERERQQRKEQLRDRFALTSAETEVALEILRGGGRASAARRLGISVATVRTHLSHIFEKTGVHRQAALVRLLLQRDDADD